MRQFLRLMLCLATVIGVLLPLSVAAEGPTTIDSPTGRYIVVLKEGASVNDLGNQIVRRSEFKVDQTYTTVFNGFAAAMAPEDAGALRGNAKVVDVIPDLPVHATAQTIPTGIRRVGATESGAAKIDGTDQRVNVDVAVIDTGVSAHADLNIAGGYDCTGAGTYSDGNGHGTHVAGTIGALDNGSGVVGVAPGARIWAVRVLDNSGSGYTSTIACGIDWVTQHASTIEVANMSLGAAGISDDRNCGNTNRDVMHQAVCKSVAAGVTYAVAAGNDGVNAVNTAPANYDEVITVSALVDTDGLAGGKGAGTSVGADDTLASFSNYGSDVDVIAPGVNIYSTYKGGSYATMSGTSMASPHVAGAAALYKSINPGATPSQVRSYLISNGSTSAWSGDRDSTKEPLISVAKIGTTTPTVTHDAQVVSVTPPASVTRGTSATVTVAVKNNGSVTESIPVRLSETPGGWAQSKTVSAAAGATVNTTFTWATSLTTATGTHTFTATTTLSTDTNAGNNTGSGTTSVVASTTTPTPTPTPSPSPTQPPAAKSMSVSSMTLSAAKVLSSYRLTTRVYVKSSGVNVSGASVTIQYTDPVGATASQTATTNSYGYATFSRTVSRTGTYTVAVTNVTKSGYSYNAAGNTVSSKSMTVGTTGTLWPRFGR